MKDAGAEASPRHEAGEGEIAHTDGQLTADLVVAADGIHSTIRQQLFPGTSPRFLHYTGWLGLAETESDMAGSMTTGRGRYFSSTRSDHTWSTGHWVPRLMHQASAMTMNATRYVATSATGTSPSPSWSRPPWKRRSDGWTSAKSHHSVLCRGTGAWHRILPRAMAPLWAWQPPQLDRTPRNG